MSQLSTTFQPYRQQVDVAKRELSGHDNIADFGVELLCGRMTDELLTLEQMDTGIVFYHEADERAYFEWLERIPCISSVNGEGSRGLVVRLKRHPGKDDLWQLLALGYRYGLDMRPFAQFETDANRDWFRDPQMFWHDVVFGR